MDPKIYLQMAGIEKGHWWFVARRCIIDKMISDLNLPEGAEILDAGCGTGGNLSMLAKHGRVFAMEIDEGARSLASKRGDAEILSGSLPHDIPFGEKSFDLVVLLDVLEHLEDDEASLRKLRTRLKPGGWILITVPAYPFLWSSHDEAHHHHRRYVQSSLCGLVIKCGYVLRYSSYFNFLLFPVVAGVRILQHIFRISNNNDLAMPSRWLNFIFTSLFASERYLIGRFSFPFGVSLLILAQVVEP